MADEQKNPEKIAFNPVVEPAADKPPLAASTPETHDEAVGRAVFDAYAKIPESQVPDKFKPILFIVLFFIMMIVFIVGYLLFKDFLPSLAP